MKYPFQKKGLAEKQPVNHFFNYGMSLQKAGARPITGFHRLARFPRL
jgi:hypothetical protein